LNNFMLWLLNYAWGFTPIKNLGYFDLCDRAVYDVCNTSYKLNLSRGQGRY
jgi:hypothetical protein